MAAPRSGVDDEYLSQIAHELRGSLNAILGWAELLRSGPCDDRARVRAAETIIRQAHQQSGMIGELIDTWRFTAGTLVFSVESFTIVEMIQSAADAVQPLARAKSVRVELEHEGPGRGHVRGDRRRLTQALTSLVLSAVHFAPEQSLVAVRLDEDEELAGLMIHDRGPAVSLAALPYLFDRRRPPGSIRASPRSTFRLGLSFVRDVIAHHRGSIQGESAGSGEGMTFRIVLPLDAAAAPPPAVERGIYGRRPDSSLAVAGLRVLLVDDEPDAREALTGILEYYGAIVRAAASADAAIAVLRRERVDVLLADIGMPGADGYDLIRSVRALDDGGPSRVPAVAVTAFASDADRRRALDAGYQVHLSKPVDPTALVATVAALGRPAASVR